jgi:hypothetical protein
VRLPLHDPAIDLVVDHTDAEAHSLC